MTRRFCVEPGILSATDALELTGPIAHRMAKVLRMRPGDEATLFDGSGTDVRATVEEISDRRVVAAVSDRIPGPAEPRVKVHLYQSITKGERFEWLLEKATEIGVSRFVPLITARSVVKPEAGGNRAERWRRIVIEAAEQCERGAVPAIEPPVRLSEALASAAGIMLLPYENADHLASTIAAALDAQIDALFALQEVSIFIGPEGGYEAGEVEAATTAGATVVTMGERVLRSETAGLVAATLVMQAVGELG
jgi:16S rRNA (uracil1498-N3)-methyltransferase